MSLAGVSVDRGGALGDGRGAVHDVARRRLLEQAVEGLALLGVERSQHLVLGGGERRLRVGQTLCSVVGQLDDVAAAVLGRAPAQDQPVGLELVEQADQVRAIGLQRGGERLLGGTAVVAQDGQGDEVSRAQAERGERRLRAQSGEPREVVEQRGGTVAWNGRGDGYKCRARHNYVVCYN
jgi:hypothetical protein